MNERLIAIVADSGSEDERNPVVLPLAMAAASAILEHHGRILLCADAAVRLPVLLAAAEYVRPIQVEVVDGRAPAPVVVAPFPADDSLEERLFTTGETLRDDREERAGRTLLAQLIDAGIADDLQNQAAPWRSFDDALRALRPAAVVVIGRTARAESLQQTAANYHRHAEGSHLVRLDRTSVVDDWPGIEERVERFRIAPRFEGQPIEDRVREDDELRRLAVHAAGDAARVLAVEDVIAAILGDLESIAPDARERG